MTIPGRTWSSSTPPHVRALIVENTDPDGSEVELWIGDPDDGISMLLDATRTRELVSDLLCRLVLIGGREAAVQAISDASRAALSPPSGEPL